MANKKATSSWDGTEREVECIDILDLKNVAVIILGTSGKEYNNQVGCACCLQMGAEGWLEILWKVPTRNFDCDTGYVNRQRMRADLLEYGEIFEWILDIEGTTEAWLKFHFILKEEYLAQHPEMGIKPGQEVKGILTWENCD